MLYITVLIEVSETEVDWTVGVAINDRMGADKQQPLSNGHQ